MHTEENSTCWSSTSTVEAARLFSQCVSSRRHHCSRTAKYITALLSAVASKLNDSLLAKCLQQLTESYPVCPSQLGATFLRDLQLHCLHLTLPLSLPPKTLTLALAVNFFNYYVNVNLLPQWKLHHRLLNFDTTWLTQSSVRITAPQWGYVLDHDICYITVLHQRTQTSWKEMIKSFYDMWLM